MSRGNPLLSFLVRLFFTHRGFTHSLLSLLLFTGACRELAVLTGSRFVYWVTWGISAGYASHILLDSLNPKGVPLFYPAGYRFSFMGIVTGGWAEKVVYAACILIAVSCSLIFIVKIF